MDKICMTCYKDPTAHSFMFVCKTNHSIDEHIYYTKVSTAKNYKDKEGIVDHYKNLLNTMNPESWIWIFDCKDFETKHYMEVSLGRELINLIQKFGKVKKILIVNHSAVFYTMVNMLKPFMNSDIKNKIVFVDNKNKEKYIIDLNLENKDINFIYQLIN